MINVIGGRPPSLDGPTDFYNPGYDLCNNGPRLIALALGRCRREERPAPWQALLDAHGVDEATFMAAVESFTRGLRDGLANESVADPEETLGEAGFFRAPRVAQLVIAAAIGQACVGAMVHGIKTRTFLGTRAVQEDSVQRVVEGAEARSKLLEK